MLLTTHGISIKTMESDVKESEEYPQSTVFWQIIWGVCFKKNTKIRVINLKFYNFYFFSCQNIFDQRFLISFACHTASLLQNMSLNVISVVFSMLHSFIFYNRLNVHVIEQNYFTWGILCIHIQILCTNMPLISIKN